MHIWWIVLPKSIIYPLTKNKMWRLNLPFLKSKRASVNAIISWSSEIYPNTSKLQEVPLSCLALVYRHTSGLQLLSSCLSRSYTSITCVERGNKRVVVICPVPNINTAPYTRRSWVQIPYRPESFSGLIFTTAQVVSNTAKITYKFIS